MVDTQYIEKKIKESGLKKAYLAEKCGCTRQYLGMKIRNEADFKVEDVKALQKELKLTDTEVIKIFFG